MKWMRVLAGVIIISLFLTGCPGKKQAERKPAEKPPKIAFAVADMRRDGTQAMKKAVDQAAKKDRIRVTWLDAKGDPLQQERDVQELIKKKVDAVVIQFVDPVGGDALVRQLQMNRIKVIALETLPPNEPVEGYIASNHRLAGELQARFVVDERGPNGGNVLILQGDPQDPMAREITDAARSALEENGYSVTVESHPRYDPKLVSQTVEKALAVGNWAAVLANESRMAVAAVEVLRTRGQTREVLTAGVGADQTAAQALMAGQHDAEIDVMPEMIGRFAFDAAKAVAREGRWNFEAQTTNGVSGVPTRIIPVRLITQENMFLLAERMQQGGQRGGQGGGQQGGQGGQSGGGQQGGQQGGQSGGQGGGGQQGGGRQQTKVMITTQDGKTMEINVPGEIKKIESMPAGQQGGQGGGQQGGGQGGGSGSQ
ncbi:sugar ABC transporter substrate-binding protein [Desulforudis sp. DRI-14]|uniref:sugar ABC transporter substrate-binding protein n=1 Tax=Desulforudis sp. DRI-14 TaxID=3459793 RepID=UPI003BC5CEA1